MYQIDETRMIKEARASLPLGSPTPSIFREGMIFLLVALICSLAQSVISATVQTFAMTADPAYYELVLSEDFSISAMLEYVSSFMENAPSWMNAVTLGASGIMILGAIVYCKAFQKRSPFTLGFNKRGVLPEYLMGIVIGAVMIALPAFVCAYTKCITFTVSGKTAPSMIAIYLLAFVLQGMGEEALFRGYFMTDLARRYNVWVAIICSALMFAAFHMGNPNFSFIAFINITLFGIFAGVFMLKRGSIWAIGAIHSAWNFVQSNVLGFSVSGNPKFDSLLTATDNGFGSILSGGEFGLEGGLGATIVLLIAILFALLMPTKNSERVAPATSTEQPTE